MAQMGSYAITTLAQSAAVIVSAYAPAKHQGKHLAVIQQLFAFHQQEHVGGQESSKRCAAQHALSNLKPGGTFNRFTKSWRIHGRPKTNFIHFIVFSLYPTTTRGLLFQHTDSPSSPATHRFKTRSNEGRGVPHDLSWKNNMENTRFVFMQVDRTLHRNSRAAG